jgi:hypothetical protein
MRKGKPMNRILVFITGALALAGCSTAQDVAFTDSVVALTKAGCHISVNLAANAGAINPGSGVQFQGSADCPGTAPVVGGPPGAVRPGSDKPAPSATFLKP